MHSLTFDYVDPDERIKLDNQLQSELHNRFSIIKRSCETLRKWEKDTDPGVNLETAISHQLEPIKAEDDVGNKREFWLHISITDKDTFQFDIMEFEVGTGANEWSLRHVASVEVADEMLDG